MEPRKIYFIGICGVAMGALAAMFHERGYAVSGSDNNIYPPMSEVLRERGIAQYNGFNAGNVGKPDLVIVGNAISRGNPELEHVLDNRVPYLSLAQALQRFFLRDKEVVAVCGTHGKSTTTALLAHILETAGLAPSFFVGGVARNTDSSYKLGSGRLFVIEGDEYDSAYFEKVPKFIFYKPDHLVLTSLEFDHADIYRDLAEIELWFARLVNMVPSAGNIVYSSDYGNLVEIMSASRSRRYSFGAKDPDFRCAFKGFSGDFSDLEVESPMGVFTLKTGLFGGFNYANINAAAAMARLLGADSGAIKEGVGSFLGVKRRQEVIFFKGKMKIYEDFAHHPTAVRYTLETMRERYPAARVWAVYEPRSATSRRNVFQDLLPASFAAADEILIKTPFEGSAVPDDRKLDTRRLLNDIRAFNEKALLLPTADDIVRHIAGSVDPAKENVIVLMSNGGFDGIYKKMAETMDRLLDAIVYPAGRNPDTVKIRAGV